MDVSSRRRAGAKAGVVAGSVWESRMKLDEVKGGIKVFTGEEKEDPQEESPKESTPQDNSPSAAKKTVRKGQGAGVSGVVASGKRKTWKSESFDGPIQIAKGKTESLPKKGLSASVDGLVVKSPPVQAKRGRSEGNDKNPIQGRRLRSVRKEVDEVEGQLRKVKSDGIKVSGQESSELGEVGGGGNVGLNEAKSEPENVSTESSPSEENCKEFGICEDGIMVVKSPPLLDYQVDDNNNDDDDDKDNVVINDGGDDGMELEGEEEDEEMEEEGDEEIEVEKKSLEIKEIGIPEEKPEKVETKEISVPTTPDDKSKKLVPKEPELKPQTLEISTPPEKPKKVAVVVNEEKRVHQLGNRTAPTSSTISRQPPPVIKRATIYQNIPKPTPTAGKGFQSYHETHNHSHSKLQNLVDLVMWRDISRSAFVFGIGTFIIISSSYTKDLNVSFISVISYMGLVYLASIFLYRSLICREIVDTDDRSYVVGEDEAIWLLKLILPYLNECLLKIKALFSGDPATTMKLAVLLFVFARCGNSITIWKLAKLGFFGVFTVPKVCSSYSSQLTAYGKFWIRRFRDAWESCSHKKAVALAIFTLVWNFTSTVARVWAVFMMFVAVRYYQQKMETCDDWEEEGTAEQTWDDDVGAQPQRSGPNQTPSSVSARNLKAKKGS